MFLATLGAECHFRIIGADCPFRPWVAPARPPTAPPSTIAFAATTNPAFAPATFALGDVPTSAHSAEDDIRRHNAASISVIDTTIDGLLLPRPHLFTPVRAAALERALLAHPDRPFVIHLVDGFTNGFRLGFTGSRQTTSTPNSKSSRDNADSVTAYINKELSLRHTVGPFPTPPLPHFVTSAIGAASKKSGGIRVTMDLSRPRGYSVNDSISRKDYSHKFARVDDAVDMILALGGSPFMAKADLQHAFRLLPVHPSDYHLLGYCWNGEFYFDTVLPFGLRSAPALFTRLAQALQWIAVTRSGSAFIIQYMDDYFFIADSAAACLRLLTIFCDAAAELGIPIAPSKTVLPNQIMVFLGIEFNTVSHRLCLPADKRVRLETSLSEWIDRRACTLRELQSLIGFLSHATKCVPAARFFLRRLLDRTIGHFRPSSLIHLDDESRADIVWWIRFMPTWDGSSPFIGSAVTPDSDIQLFTDASSSIGCGGYFAGHWFTILWPPAVIAASLPIAVLELSSIVVAAIAWGERLSGLRVRFHCDNEVVVAAWNKRSTRSPLLMSRLRALFFVASHFHFAISLMHVPGLQNPIADALSRNDMPRFRALAPTAARAACPVPELDFLDLEQDVLRLWPPILGSLPTT